MPIDFDILSAYGSTNERLREFFTCELPKDPPGKKASEEEKKNYERIKRDIENREKFYRIVRGRLEEHILFSLKNYALYAAADIAWDSTTITKTTIPLLLYAQGKISIEHCVNQLKNLNCANEFIREVERDGKKVAEIDLPKLTEFSVNLVRSIITRRLAAQSNKYNNLWPYYKYEPRSTGLPARLRADVLSQRVDIMADQFDYRHHDTQVMRDAFLYGHSVDFPRASWEIEKQWEKDDVNPAFAPSNLTSGEENKEINGLRVKTVIVREGVAWVNPHPSRVFWDNAYPLPSINTDTGCEYIGYWDVCRYGDIYNNPNYWNRDKISYSQNLWSYYGQYTDYFNQYLQTVKPPYQAQRQVDIAAENDRTQNIGFYSAEMQDSSVFKAEYFQKIIPKDWGIGDYPFPVWVRFIMASDDTCIFAEFMPSTPAAVLSVNENDSRLVNVSIAHEIIPFQDQMTNLSRQMLMMVEAEILKVISANTDMLTEEQVKAIRERLSGQNYSTKGPVVVEYSGSKARENGMEPSEVIRIHETKIGTTITAIFQAMAQLISLMEKLLALSPAEQGQPAPREISATEVNEIASTTQSVYSFISDAIDEFRAAKKRIIYESLICCGQEEFTAPVQSRYPKKVIEEAGFKVIPEEEEEFANSERRRHTVIGTKKLLRHDYVFTSRDGSERPMNTQAANTLVQLVAQIAAFPPVIQAMGKEKLYEIFNEIFRLSGAGLDLNLELAPGEDNSFGADEIEQLKEIIQQLGEALKQNAQDMQQVKETLPALTDAVKKSAEDIQQLFSMMSRQNAGQN